MWGALRWQRGLLQPPVARGKWRGFCPDASARHTLSAATHTDGRAGRSNVALSQVIILRQKPGTVGFWVIVC